MVDLNTTIELIQPLSNALNDAFQVVQVMVGGIIGLYLIYGIVMWYRNNKYYKLMSEMKHQLELLNQRMDSIEQKMPNTKRKKK